MDNNLKSVPSRKLLRVTVLLQMIFSRWEECAAEQWRRATRWEPPPPPPSTSCDECQGFEAFVVTI